MAVPGARGGGEFQGQGDQLVVAFGHVVEQQVFQHAQAALANGLVAVQRLAVGRVDARAVDADQQHAEVGELFDGLGGEGGQVVVEGVLRLAFIHTQQHALWQAFQSVCDVFGLHQRAAADGVDHAAGAEKRVERDFADGRAAGVVVQRCVGVCAHVGRERDGAHVDRAARADGGGPGLGVGRVARENRGGGVHGWGDVPEFFHGAVKVAP